MARRERCFWVALSIALLGFAATPGAPQTNRHRGMVVEMQSQRPLYTEIVAYASNQRTEAPSDCPTFDDFIIGTLSEQSDGSFTLPIPVEVVG